MIQLESTDLQTSIPVGSCDIQIHEAIPREEQYERGCQLRRSARSIPANVVEAGPNESGLAGFKRHLLIAAGELVEAKFWMELAREESLTDPKSAEGLVKEHSKGGIDDSQTLEGVEKIVEEGGSFTSFHSFASFTSRYEHFGQ